MNLNLDRAKQDKIKLLVIPSAYPAHEDDIKGVFVLDYLKSVDEYCEITVLRATIESSGPEIEQTKTFGFDTIHYRALLTKRAIGSKFLNYAKMIFAPTNLLEELKKRKPDLIHVHGSTMHGLLAQRISKQLGIPYVVSEHTGPYSKISEHFVFKRMSKRVIEASAKLFSVSADLEQQILQSGIRPQSATVTFNPVDTELFALGKQSKEFVFVGRYEPYKGAMRVLMAFHQITDQLPEWKLKLIGGGKEAVLMQDYIANNVLQNRVTLLGQLNKGQISEHLQKAGVFVFPSEHETFGIVIAEGMSCGLPVVVGNKTAPKEFVGAEQGLLVNPTNVSSIAEAMMSIAKNQSKFNSKEIRDYVVAKFGFKSFGKSLYGHYRQVIAN